ncbi:chaperonin 10-like protein [Xylariales sp. PMI_506]|nr:chaperonin 10-like protein [Xylariales sp. PMI_506]
MSTDYKFEGWLGHSADAVHGKMIWGEFEPKKWEDDDVDIKVTHCGVCGTDAHLLGSAWGPTHYPCCAGHEIIGIAVKVGIKVTEIKPGDRVGVGSQARSCLQPTCSECSTGREVYCPHIVTTYGAVFPNGAGRSYGGYATYHRAHRAFVFKIPDALPSEAAAPLLCAGISLYTPLKEHGCGPDKHVGILGIGGLGHLGILFAKALGAGRVVAISRSASKRDDALALGADEYLATAEEDDWAAKRSRSLDFIISTASSADMPLDQYMSMLKVGGTFVQLGVHGVGNLPVASALKMIFNKLSIAGSASGSPNQIREMLQLAADKQVMPWVQTIPMSKANRAIVELEEGKPRYRYVLVNEALDK